MTWPKERLIEENEIDLVPPVFTAAAKGWDSTGTYGTFSRHSNWIGWTGHDHVMNLLVVVFLQLSCTCGKSSYIRFFLRIRDSYSALWEHQCGSTSKKSSDRGFAKNIWVWVTNLLWSCHEWKLTSMLMPSIDDRQIKTRLVKWAALECYHISHTGQQGWMFDGDDSVTPWRSLVQMHTWQTLCRLLELQLSSISPTASDWRMTTIKCHTLEFSRDHNAMMKWVHE